MALIAWFPMNGNLDDHSGRVEKLTNSGSNSLTDTGKIGSAYTKTDGSYQTDIVKFPQNGSISMWFRHNGSNWVDECLFGTRLGNNGFMFYRNGGDPSGYYRIYFFYNNSNGGISSFHPWPGIYNFEADRWYNLIMTRTSIGRLTFYRDGQLMYDMQAPSDFLSWNDSGGRLSFHSQGNGSSYTGGNISFNEIRVYDHDLSTKEIIELQKPRILHYSFDEYQEPLEDLSGSINSVFGPWSGMTGSSSYFTSPTGVQGIYLKTTSTGGVRYYAASARAQVSPLTAYTVSAYIKYSNSPSPNLFYIREYNSSGTHIRETGLFSPGRYTEDLGDGWRRYYGTITTRSDTASIALEGYEYNPKEIWIYNWQLEERQHPSEFGKPKREAVVLDMSNNGNNAPIIPKYSPVWTSEAARGTGAYDFSKSDCGFSSPNIGNPRYALTITAWVNPEEVASTHDRGIILGKESTYFLTITPGRKISCGWYGTSTGQYHTTNQVLEAGKWSHVASVWDGTNLHIYINGALSRSFATKTPGLSSNGDIMIGHESFTRRYFKGMLDEISVFAESLNQEEILNLIKKSVSMDEKGILWAHQVLERENLVEETNLAISKKRFESGISSANQAHNNTTVTDKGIRIYRTPNLIYSTAGDVMWGGLRYQVFQIDPFILKKWHKYRLSFDVEGQTSSPLVNPYFTSNMGWGGWGLTSVPVTTITGVPANFDGRTKVISEFYITDDIWKVCTRSYSIFIEGNYYNCYRDLAIGFTYGDTGPLGTDIYLSNFKLLDITDNETYSLSEKGVLKVNEKYEKGGAVRYIRDWVNGSNKNASSHWVEIQAYSVNGENLAKGKTSESNLLTDGKTDSSPYYDAGVGYQSVTVDLGSIYRVHEVGVWHYHADQRIYYDTKTEVSEDGVNWTTIFDSAEQGTYTETRLGNIIPVKSTSIGIDYRGNLYSREYRTNNDVL